MPSVARTRRIIMFTIITGSHFKVNHMVSLKCSTNKIKGCFSGAWMELDDPFPTGYY